MRLRKTLGLPALVAWARSYRPHAVAGLTDAALSNRIAALVAQLPEAAALYEAAIRLGIGLAGAADRHRIETSLGHLLSNKEDAVEELLKRFQFDLGRLPLGFGQDAFTKAVQQELKNNLNVADDSIALPAVIGMLLLDEHADPTDSQFSREVQDAYLEFLGKMANVQGGQTNMAVVYTKIVEILQKLHGDGGKIFFQELAHVGRYVQARGNDVPFGHASFGTQVRLADDSYVSAPPLDTLELPPLSGDDVAQTELTPDNIHAVATLSASRHLDRGVSLFRVVDRMTEMFMNGMVAVGLDSGGRALDKYYWGSELRMNEAARMMQYARIFGDSGVDVSREVQPNKDFDTLFMRFLSAIVEYDRQQRVDNLFTGGQNGNGSRFSATISTGEAVRKAGRDLAANVSLYGYGYTHFAARRLAADIKTALDILAQPSILKFYGVSSPWQVIERVSSQEWGQAPNIVKYRTMAEASKAILDLVAQYSGAWVSTAGRQLFQDPGATGINLSNNVRNFDIPFNDYKVFVLHANNWLVVNGIKDTQVEEASQPTESAYAPSIPSYGGMDGKASSNGSGNIERLKQMVQAGQVPDIGTLRGLLG
jgi:hypothetical protein